MSTYSNQGAPRNGVPAHAVRTQPQTRADHFSLAGPTQTVGSMAQRQATTSSFVTEEYEEHNPGYNDAQNYPVWGVAKPLPRVMRPGMTVKRRRTQEDPERDGQQTRQQDHSVAGRRRTAARPDNTSESPPGHKIQGSTQAIPQLTVTPSHNKGREQGTEPAPQVNATPSRDSRQSQPRRQPLQESRGPGRTSTTSDNASTARTASKISALEGEHIYTQDQALPSHGSQPNKTFAGLEDIPSSRNLTQSSTTPPEHPNYAARRMDKLIEGHELGLSSLQHTEEDETNTGRNKVQGYADSAEYDDDLWQAPANTDWEEFQNHQKEVGMTPSRQMTQGTMGPQFFNLWGYWRHQLRQPLAEWLGRTTRFYHLHETNSSVIKERRSHSLSVYAVA